MTGKTEVVYEDGVWVRRTYLNDRGDHYEDEAITSTPAVPEKFLPWLLARKTWMVTDDPMPTTRSVLS